MKDLKSGMVENIVCSIVCVKKVRYLQWWWRFNVFRVWVSCCTKLCL